MHNLANDNRQSNDDSTPKIDTIPRSFLNDGVDGKILLINFEREYFLRSCDEQGIHLGIETLFRTELSQNGYSSDEIEQGIHVAGGAWIKYENEKIIIHASSDQYGRCRDHEVKNLIQALYPDRKLVFESH